MATGTLGDTVAQHLYERFAQLGIITKAPLQTQVPNQPEVKTAAPDLPALTAQIKQETYEEAVRNQRYYLEQAAKTGKPWFHHPKHQRQYSEHVLVSPAMAAQLEEYNVENRRRTPKDVEALARDMQNERWLQTEESLGIDIYGMFYNGQHRTGAIQMAGIPVVMYVTFQVPPGARFVIDSGRKRPTATKLEMLFGKDKTGNKTPAICKAMMEGALRTNQKVSESEIAAFMSKHGEIIAWAIKAMPKTRADVQAAIAKAALWHGVAKVEPFCERFRAVTFPRPDDPACALYKWLQRVKGQLGVAGGVVYRKTAYAIECDLAGKSCLKVQEREKDIFEWENGWDVPANAPSKAS